MCKFVCVDDADTTAGAATATDVGLKQDTYDM
jgi:hypothetical protein